MTGKNINSLIKVIFSSLSFVSMIFYITNYVFAAQSSAPDFSELTPILVRIINVLMISAGAVLVAMIAYGVWKSSLSTGDPRALEGAKSTWTYALYGFFIVVGAFAIIMIVEGVIGVSSGSSGGLVRGLVNSIVNLMSIESGCPQTCDARPCPCP
jgi:hypothetical protein